MKQNMCVTIDEEIHSWLKNKNEMMSRLVNRILWKAMQKEMQERGLNSGQQSTLPLWYCEQCKRYPGNSAVCKCGNKDIKVISDQTSSQ